MGQPGETPPVRGLPSRGVARRIRENAGLSRRVMADMLGIHEQTLIRWELGYVYPSGRNLIAYSELLARLTAGGET